MRVGELSRRSGVGVPMIKYYLREDMLPAGKRTGAPNQAEYDHTHLRRLRLLRALTEEGELPGAAIKKVVSAIDGGLPLNLILGVVQESLVNAPPRPTTNPPNDASAPAAATTAGEELVAGLVTRRGWRVDARNPGWRAAAQLLNTTTALGVDDQASLLDVYAQAMETVAGHEVARLVDADDREGTVEAVVSKLVLGDALLSSLRAMAHQDATLRRLGTPWCPDPAGHLPSPDVP